MILFIFGLEHFSKEIEKITGERFRKFLGNATKFPVVSVLIGAVITAIIQSSSATSIIAISLVNAGVMSFKSSVGIIFGSNIGTTVTAQLVAFKLTAFAPLFIILGFLLSIFKSKYSVFAKSLFYFGFVFFSLNLISSSMAPLQSNEQLLQFLTTKQNPLIGVIVGCVITAIIQSSSVTTGLAIIFTQQGLISIDNAIPILMGANIGTTATAMIAVFNMDLSAKKSAFAHFLFNVGGVAIFLPALYLLNGHFPLLSDDPAIALANFHLAFNLTTSLIFLAFLNPFTKFIDKVMGEGKMDFERIDMQFMKEKDLINLDIEIKLERNIMSVYSFIQENCNLITLSLETNYKGIYEAAKKRIEYVDFVQAEHLNYFSHFVGSQTEQREIHRIIRVIEQYEYVFQIHESVKDLAGIKKNMAENFIEFKSDALMIIRDMINRTYSYFTKMSGKEGQIQEKLKLKAESKKFDDALNEYRSETLKMMAQPDRRDAGLLLHLISCSQRLKDKIAIYRKLITPLDEKISKTEKDDIMKENLTIT